MTSRASVHAEGRRPRRRPGARLQCSDDRLVKRPHFKITPADGAARGTYRACTGGRVAPELTARRPAALSAAKTEDRKFGSAAEPGPDPGRADPARDVQRNRRVVVPAGDIPPGAHGCERGDTGKADLPAMSMAAC